MKLKHGKKYETADGVIYRVRDMNDEFFDESDKTNLLWRPDGSGVGNTDLIRRHYTKPQPAHKLDLKQGDVVELVAWEDGSVTMVGEKIPIGNDGKLEHRFYELNGWNKGHRPLFRVVSRA